MTSQDLRVGVIGLGNMGKNHVRNYAQLTGASLHAVCDVQKDLVTSFSEKYQCQPYTSLTEMLENANLDAVSITVPTRFHFEIAKTVIEAGVHVLIEKPICDSYEDAIHLKELAETHKVTLMVGHIERFNPAVTMLKSLIDEGAFGKVTSLIAKRVGAFPAQIKDANVIIDLAVHDIDIFSYLLGQQPDSVYGNAGRALNDGREDYAELFLTYGDQNGFIQVNWITPIRIRNIAITGTKGYAELNYMTQELTFYESNYHNDFDTFGDYIIKFGTPHKRDIQVEKKEPLGLELAHFLDCIRTQSSPLIDAQCGIDALGVALKLMQNMGMTNQN